MNRKTPKHLAESVKIGLVLPRLFKFYNHEAVEGMVTYAADRSWLHFVDCRFFDLASVVPLLKPMRLDGLILGLNYGEFQFLRPHLPRKVPMVNIHSDKLTPAIPTVRIDQTALAAAAVDYLCQLGFKHLACIGVPQSLAFTEYSQHLKHHARTRGATVMEFRVGLSPGLYTTGQMPSIPEFDRWLMALPRPIAITTTGGYSASFLNQSAHRLGLRVPDDVAILSLSDDEPCLFADPAISSFSSLGVEIGKRALQIVDDMLRGTNQLHGCMEIAPSMIIERRSSGYASSMDENIKGALRYLRTHACEGISVEDVVKQVPYISRSALFQEIQRYTGHAPAAEIRRIKIERACHLLAHTNQPVARIAEQCGFASDTQFSITFRRITGHSPRAHRQLHNPPK